MKNTINLLPEESPEEKAARTKTRNRIIFVFVLLFLTAIASLIPFLIAQNEKRRERVLASEISRQEQTVARLVDKERLYRSVFNKLSAVKVIFQSQKTLTADIENLKGILSPGIALSDIAIDKNKVTMTVQTFDLASIYEYINALEDENQAQKFLKNLVIASVSVDKFGGYKVKIEGTLLP